MQWEAGYFVRTDRQAVVTKMTVAFHNFTNSPKNVFFAIKLFSLKLICKNIKRKFALDLPANNTAHLLIVTGKMVKLSHAYLSATS